jgi:catechol-2,3-dioxygenase
MKLARVILFTGQMHVMSKFYGEVLGLKLVTNEFSTIGTLTII